MFLIYTLEKTEGQSRMDNTETLVTLSRSIRLQKTFI